ncbi:MAG: DUF547 domain-containing protein [Pseudomonadota bacterium]
MRLVFALIALLTAPFAAAAETDLHAPWDELLQRYVSPHPDGVNRVDYALWRDTAEDRETLEAYIRALEVAAPSAMAPDDAFAYWANLYNAVTIKVILDEAPERSIRQIRPRPWSIGPWGVSRVTVEGEAFSLDDIEHGVMRPRFEAALVHYAVNCASIGCPNLEPTAWRGEGLAERLDRAARAYVNHPRGVTVTERGLVVSRIYRWFREDFGDSEAGVIAHVLAYAEPELAAAINANRDIAGHAYDWALNQTE